MENLDGGGGQLVETDRFVGLDLLLLDGPRLLQGVGLAGLPQHHLVAVQAGAVAVVGRAGQAGLAAARHKQVADLTGFHNKWDVGAVVVVITNAVGVVVGRGG